MLKSVVSGVLLTALALVAILVTVESTLRITGYGLNKEKLRSIHELRLDRPWLYGLRPGAREPDPEDKSVIYEINRDGYRGRLYPIEKPAGTFRILVLGNSVAFGARANESAVFPTRLEELLNQDSPGRRYEVINFAVPGYNAYNQEMQLADRGLDYQPDLVLAQFSVGGLHNPILHFDHQTQMHLGMIPAEAFPDPSQRRPPPRFPTLVRACGQLRLCSLLDQRYLAPRRRRENPMPPLVSIRNRDIESGVEREWVRRRYRRMRSKAREAGADLVIVPFPYREQIYSNASRKLQEQLAALGREEGWVLIDLFASFQSAADNNAPPLFVDSWHVTPTGHEIAAESIYQQLRERNLLPAG